MYSLDSLTLQYFHKENYDFISQSVVQKIQLPSRYEVILNIRNIKKSENKKLYININPKYPHVCFINNKTMEQRNIEIPKNPPMFCMQLRKYLNGSKIKAFKVIKYERIIELYFDYFNEIGSLTPLCLSIELMGKHSNIILYNANNKNIIGAMHNISQEKSSIREIYGGIKYFYPPQKEKLDLLNTSYSTFSEITKERDIKKISNAFYYFNQALLEKLLITYSDTSELFSKMQKLQNLEDINYIKNFWQQGETLSDSIDNYFSSLIFKEILKDKKAKLKKHVQKDYKKIIAKTQTPPESSKTEKYKLYGDLIMCNLYNIKKNQNILQIDEHIIELEKNLTPTQNAQKYYTQYKKLKTALEINTKRYNNAKDKQEYYESVIFNIENADTFKILNEIEEELSFINTQKNKTVSSNKTSIEKISYNNWEIYIGKNNHQNDYLISKIATGEDLWFHGLNYPSSHVILKLPNNKKEPTPDVLEFCAKLTKENSKAKNSGKSAIIYTKRKNIKKPPNTYPGYVTYKNETEIII